MWSTLTSKLSRWVPGLSRAQTAKNRANAHGNKAKGLLRISTLLWAVLLIVLLVAIWWLGPGWEIRDVMPLAPLTNRLLATLAVVTLIAVIWGVRLARRLRTWMKSVSTKTLASKIRLCRRWSDKKRRSTAC